MFQLFAKTDDSRTTQFLADFKTAGEATNAAGPAAGQTWPDHIGLPMAAVRLASK